jgi:enamine deaminase RidA (YjgF/YER057c/UK114 family)
MTASPSENIRRLQLELPEPAEPAFNYVPVVVHGGLVFVSGQLPKQGGEVRVRGRVGAEVDVQAAQEAARICTLQGLAVAAEALGDLDQISRVIRVTGYVASADSFYEQPRVIDAASELLTGIFGEYGRHARSAVGVASLPRNASVEIEFVFARGEEKA